MIKNLTLIIFFIFAFSALRVSANDDLLEVSDFNYVSTKTTQAKHPASQIKKTGGKPASLSISHKKELVIKKPVTKSIIQKPVSKTIPAKSTKLPNIPKSFKGTYVTKTLENPKFSASASKSSKLVVKEIKRKPVIVIDPGHGGKDRGTTGKLGTKEKDITLAYSLALKKELEKSGKYKVVLTRTNDKFIELGERVAIARKAGGDVMISIHADSNPNKTTRGFSVYTLSSRRASAEAQKLLEKSSKEEVVRGASIKGESRDVREAIIGFAQGSTKEVSNDFAKTIGKNLGRRIQSLNKYNRQGSLAVLTGADIPSVLIELGYLSNDYEERLLKREDHKKKIVTSIKNAIDEYFSRFNLVF